MRNGELIDSNRLKTIKSKPGKIDSVILFSLSCVAILNSKPIIFGVRNVGFYLIVDILIERHKIYAS